MRAAAFAELARTRRGKMRGGLRIAALGFGCELCGQLEDLLLVVRGQGLKQCEDVGDVVHFSSLGHPCVFGAGWNYSASPRRFPLEHTKNGGIAMICKDCGREIPEHSIYCNWCGVKQLRELKTPLTSEPPRFGHQWCFSCFL